MMASLDPRKTVHETLLVMALAEESQGLFESAGIHPLYTGMGGMKATFALTRAIYELKPKRVLNLGTAGSFTLAQGICVECSAFVQRQGTAKLLPAKKIVTSHFVTDLPKAICGTADFVENSPDGSTRYGYTAMDMESYALAFVAQQMAIPFYAIKFVSDSSGSDVYSKWKNSLPTAAKSLLEIHQSLRF